MIYIFKATLSKAKLFMREFEVKSDTNLYKLHEFIQNELAFAPDQMVCFEGLNDKGKMVSEYGLFDLGSGTMDTVKVEDLIEKGETTFRYVFDFNKYRYIQLELIGETEVVERVSYPRTTAEKGRNPDQFSALYEEFDEDLYEDKQTDEEGVEESELEGMNELTQE